jgi:dihydrofolate reductase
MGRIRLYFATSLDGYIADPQGGVAFLEPFQDENQGIGEFFSTISTLVMGRDTYQFAEDYGSWPYRKTRVIVLTHRPIERPLCELETRIVDDISAFARELRAAEGDVWILGGGKVMGAFLCAGEVDTIEMTIVPVAIGSGIPMYAGSESVTHRFNLVDLTQSSGGVVHLSYER